MRTTHVICGCDIEYANGAVVRTSFVTNMGGDVIAKSEPELTRIVNDKAAELRNKKASELPKYVYPDNVLTAAMLQKYAKYGVEFEVKAKDCCRISKMDEQSKHGKTIFGCGLLMSDSKAAEKAAAEKAAAEKAKPHVWELSERERKIVKMLG